MATVREQQQSVFDTMALRARIERKLMALELARVERRAETLQRSQHSSLLGWLDVPVAE